MGVMEVDHEWESYIADYGGNDIPKRFSSGGKRMLEKQQQYNRIDNSLPCQPPAPPTEQALNTPSCPARAADVRSAHHTGTWKARSRARGQA